MKYPVMPDMWATGVLFDGDRVEQSDGTPENLLIFELTRPLAYAGRRAYWRVNEKLDKTLETLARFFPDVNFLATPREIFESLGGVPVRIHVMVDEARHDETTGKDYERRNRVSGVYPNDYKGEDELADDGGDELPEDVE